MKYSPWAIVFGIAISSAFTATAVAEDSPGPPAQSQQEPSGVAGSAISEEDKKDLCSYFIDVKGLAAEECRGQNLDSWSAGRTEIQDKIRKTCVWECRTTWEKTSQRKERILKIYAELSTEFKYYDGTARKTENDDRDRADSKLFLEKIAQMDPPFTERTLPAWITPEKGKEEDFKKGTARALAGINEGLRQQLENKESPAPPELRQQINLRLVSNKARIAQLESMKTDAAQIGHFMDKSVLGSGKLDGPAPVTVDAAVASAYERQAKGDPKSSPELHASDFAVKGKLPIKAVPNVSPQSAGTNKPDGGTSPGGLAVLVGTLAIAGYGLARRATGKSTKEESDALVEGYHVSSQMEAEEKKNLAQQESDFKKEEAAAQGYISQAQKDVNAEIPAEAQPAAPVAQNTPPTKERMTLWGSFTRMIATIQKHRHSGGHH